MILLKDSIDIEYMGKAGITQTCVDAITRLIQYRDIIKQVRILSSSGRHCLLLTRYSGGLVAIKSGFSSGYTGTGPKKFSYILQLLQAHNIDMDEYEVSNTIIDKIDNSKLTEEDIFKIKTSRPVHPVRLYDYINNQDFQSFQNGTLWKEFRPIIPFAIIDNRIIDLAINFWDNPDTNLLNGYRRLEDIVRNKSGETEHGARLFSNVFSSKKPILTWENIPPSEQIGRANLFIGAYSAHRNPRAHKEVKIKSSEVLSEFLVLNHLFTLEQSSILNN